MQDCKLESFKEMLDQGKLNAACFRADGAELPLSLVVCDLEDGEELLGESFINPLSGNNYVGDLETRAPTTAMLFSKKAYVRFVEDLGKPSHHDCFCILNFLAESWIEQGDLSRKEWDKSKKKYLSSETPSSLLH